MGGWTEQEQVVRAMNERGVTPRTDRPVVIPGPRIEPANDPDLRRDLFDPRIQHTVSLAERGQFTVAVCAGCGWESFARRSRPLARSEGRDHVLLFGG